MTKRLYFHQHHHQYHHHCDRQHPANEEEHKENRSQAEQLRILVEGGGDVVPNHVEEGGGASQDSVGALEGKDEGDGEAKGWAIQEELVVVRRTGETEDEEEEKKKLEKAKMEEEQEVKKLDEMIALREKEQEKKKLKEKEEEEIRKAREEAEVEKKEEAEVEKKEEAQVDEENNSIPVTPVRKILSRTSSFEVRQETCELLFYTSQVIRSKTIILEETNERMERTTMNITQTKVFSRYCSCFFFEQNGSYFPSQEPPQPVELKIKVRSPVARPAIMLQTKGDENGVVGESGEELDPDAGGRSSGEESPGADTDAGRSPQFLLEKAPLPTQRLTREVKKEFLIQRYERYECLMLRCECCQRWCCRCQSGTRTAETRTAAKILHQVGFIK